MNTDMQTQQPTGNEESSTGQSRWATTETAMKDAFERTEGVFKQALDESAKAVANAGTSLKKAVESPAGGATIAGGAALGAAAMFGALPTLLGAGAAYVTYLLVRKKHPNPTP